MKLGNIVKAYREERKLTVRAFAKICNLSCAYISMIENGRNPNTGKPIAPNIETLNKLATGMCLTIDTLLQMMDDDQLISLKNPVPDNILPLPATRRIPLLGDIACGEPILAEENLDGSVEIPDDISADFALRCKGDSMINARIFDTDIVYIRQQPTVENGEIAAVLIENDATLKRVYMYDDHIVLQAENPQFKPLVYWEEEMNTIKILGKAVAFTSTVR